MTKLVSIIMGSDSDWPVMKSCSETLNELDVAHDVRVFSAHRTPEQLREYMAAAMQSGTKIFVAAAGGAAHLPGVVASETTLPVIGVPMESVLKGMDSLLSIAQMPGGIPVATMAIGKAGAVNAALQAVSILSVADEKYAKTLQAFRQNKREKVLRANEALQSSLV